MSEILVVAAHADDETLGAGGVIPRLVDRGHNVSIVLASDAQFDRDGVGHVDNMSDFEAATRRLGVETVARLDLPDQRFDTIPMGELNQRLGAVACSPDIIITHSDDDLNMDHRLVAEAVRVVARPFRRPVSILAMEIGVNNSWNGRPFQPDFYVDISKTLAAKQEAFACYKNEGHDFPHPYSEDGIEALARMRGMESGYKLAEAFKVVRLHSEHFLGF